MMRYDEKNNCADDLISNSDSDDSESSTEEIPVWVKGEQRWVSGIIADTTCQEVVQVLLQNEKDKGRNIGQPEEYHITEKWRGVEQPLDPDSAILDIWNAWGSAQEEVKIMLRRTKPEKNQNRRLRRTDSSTWSDKNSFKTLHPKKLYASQNEKIEKPSNTEELLKLVLAQGEIIKRQLKKLRHSEHQIGHLEDKTHRARVRKHGSNYLLETYLKGLPDAVTPEEHVTMDKNSDSGVVTEGDSEQSNNVKPTTKDKNGEIERLSSASPEAFVDTKDEETSSVNSEATLRERVQLVKKINKLNKQLLKQEEILVRLDANIKKYEKYKSIGTDLTNSLTIAKTEVAKSACEVQHNDVVLEETNEIIKNKKYFLDALFKDMLKEDQEHEMLETMIYSSKYQPQFSQNYHSNSNTKELLDTLV